MSENPHGEARLNPENYGVVDFVDWSPWDGMAVTNPDALKWMMEELDRMRALLRAGTSVYGTGQCAHCGSWLRYGVVLRDVRDGAHLQVGQDCASNRFALTEGQWADKKAKLDRMREQALAGEKRIAARGEHPEATAILEMFISEFEATGRRGERWGDFLADVGWRFQRDGQLSQAQADAVVRIFAEDIARAESRAYQQEEREAAGPVPTGKGVELEGEVVSLKWRDNQWGGSLKMIVKLPNGSRVWGTCPSALEEALAEAEGRDNFIELEYAGGARVRFVANVEAADDDPSFGFFKRPRSAELLTSISTREAPCA